MLSFVVPRAYKITIKKEVQTIGLCVFLALLSPNLYAVAEYFSIDVGRGSANITPSITAGGSNVGASATERISSSGNPFHAALSIQLYENFYTRFDYTFYGDTQISFVSNLFPEIRLRSSAFSALLGYAYPNRTFGFHFFGEAGVASVRITHEDVDPNISLTIQEPDALSLSLAGGFNYFLSNGWGLTLLGARPASGYEYIGLSLSYRFSLTTDKIRTDDSIDSGDQISVAGGGIRSINEEGIETGSDANNLQSLIDSGDLSENNALFSQDSAGENAEADFDSDGIPDSQDLCSDSRLGAIVDSVGCATTDNDRLASSDESDALFSDADPNFSDRSLSQSKKLLETVDDNYTNNIIELERFVFIDNDLYDIAQDDLDDAPQDDLVNPADASNANTPSPENTIEEIDTEINSRQQAFTKNEFTIPLGTSFALPPARPPSSGAAADNNQKATNDVNVSNIISFDTGSSRISPENQARLKTVVESMQSASYKAKLSVFAGTGPSVEFNQWLANRQALNVANFLLENGITQSRILYDPNTDPSQIPVDSSKQNRVFIEFSQ